ncbi:MAG: hypothetical protein AB8G15_19765 [Saprospiraceae bacterium]
MRKSIPFFLGLALLTLFACNDEPTDSSDLPITHNFAPGIYEGTMWETQVAIYKAFVRIKDIGDNQFTLERADDISFTDIVNKQTFVIDNELINPCKREYRGAFFEYDGDIDYAIVRFYGCDSLYVNEADIDAQAGGRFFRFTGKKIN